MATSRNKVKPIHVIQVREFANESNPSDLNQAVVPPTTTGKIDVLRKHTSYALQSAYNWEFVCLCPQCNYLVQVNDHVCNSVRV